MKRILQTSLGLLLLWVAGTWAGNSHSGTGDVSMEFRTWWGDGGTGYVASGCLHTTSGTTSAAIASCRAFALNTGTPRQLEYIEDLASRTVTYSTGDGTYWLIAHASTTEAVSGWTRVGVSHYLWQKSTTQPLLPSRGAWLARVTVAGSDITVVQDWRSSNPLNPQLLRVTDPIFGAIPDDGVNDRVAVQNAFFAAQRGKVIVEFPPGIYDLDGDSLLAIQGLYGTNTAVAIEGASQVTIRGYGATIRQGATALRVMGIFASSHVKVEGLHWIGHTETISQQKHALVIGHNASHVEVTRNYFTNFLGECIAVGGNFSTPLTGFESEHVHIHHNTCKERVGNGISSVSGGTKSRLAFSVVDGRYVTIENNLIYGVVDLEPDINGQWMYHIYVRHNTFHSGPVTPQSTIGTTYWHEEPIVDPGVGGSVIDGAITFTGVATTLNTGEIYFVQNSFERASISCVTLAVYVCGIMGNTFNEGLIFLGGSGQSITFAHVANNATKFPYPGQTTFIRLDGLISNGMFFHNIASVAGGYVIDNGPGSSGDNGNNLFLGNFNRSATGAGQIGFTINPSSILGGF